MVFEVPPSPASTAATHPNHSSLELAAVARGCLFSLTSVGMAGHQRCLTCLRGLLAAFTACFASSFAYARIPSIPAVSGS
jgi:hypothetical protein